MEMLLRNGGESKFCFASYSQLFSQVSFLQRYYEHKASEETGQMQILLLISAIGKQPNPNPISIAH